MKFFAIVIIMMAATAAHADTVACYGEKGQSYYDPDFCRAIKVSKEAFALTRQMIERSEAIRRTIDEQSKNRHDNRPANPGR